MNVVKQCTKVLQNDTLDMRLKPTTSTLGLEHLAAHLIVEFASAESLSVEATLLGHVETVAADVHVC